MSTTCVFLYGLFVSRRLFKPLWMSVLHGTRRTIVSRIALWLDISFTLWRPGPQGRPSRPNCVFSWTHCMDTPRTFGRPLRLGQHTGWRRLAMLDRLCAAGVNELRSGMSQQYYSNVFFAYQGGSLPQLPMPHDGEPRRLQCVTSAGSSADTPTQPASVGDEPLRRRAVHGAAAPTPCHVPE